MIRDARTIHPDDVKPGDTFVAVITLKVTRQSGDGKLLVRGYRCQWPDTAIGKHTGEPQGTQIDPVLLGSIIEAIAPVLRDAGSKPDI